MPGTRKIVPCGNRSPIAQTQRLGSEPRIHAGNGWNDRLAKTGSAESQRAAVQIDGGGGPERSGSATAGEGESARTALGQSRCRRDGINRHGQLLPRTRDVDRGIAADTQGGNRTPLRRKGGVVRHRHARTRGHRRHGDRTGHRKTIARADREFALIGYGQTCRRMRSVNGHQRGGVNHGRGAVGGNGARTPSWGGTPITIHRTNPGDRRRWLINLQATNLGILLGPARQCAGGVRGHRHAPTVAIINATLVALCPVTGISGRIDERNGGRPSDGIGRAVIVFVIRVNPQLRGRIGQKPRDCPVHPRTTGRIEAAGVDSSDAQLGASPVALLPAVVASIGIVNG